MHPVVEIQNAAQSRGLAGAGAACDQQELFRRGGADGLPLQLGVADLRRGLDPRQQPGQIDRQGGGLARHFQEPGRQIPLRLPKLGQIDGLQIRDPIGDHPLLGGQALQPLGDRLAAQMEKLRRDAHQSLAGHENVPAAGVVIQFIQNARVHAALVVAVHPLGKREGVHAGEVGPEALPGQEVGVVGDRHHRQLSVGAEDRHGQLCGQTALRQKFGQMPEPLLRLEALVDFLGPGCGNAADFDQPGVVVLNDVQALRAEPLHDLRRHLRPDAPDRVGGQIGQNFDPALGHQPLHRGDLKLPPIGGVLDPPPLHAQALAHRGAGHDAHHGHGLLAAGVQPEHAVAVLRVLKHHGSDAALQLCPFRFHSGIHSNAASVSKYASRLPAATSRTGSPRRVSASAI